MFLCSSSALYLSIFVATLWRACLRVTMYTRQASVVIHTYLNVYTHLPAGMLPSVTSLLLRRL
jgi:hypothetical protein